jgi:hypothetical protein
VVGFCVMFMRWELMCTQISSCDVSPTHPFSSLLVRVLVCFCTRCRVAASEEQRGDSDAPCATTELTTLLT